MMNKSLFQHHKKFLHSMVLKSKELKEENKQWKEENKQLRKENEQWRKNNVIKDATIKE